MASGALGIGLALRRVGPQWLAASGAFLLVPLALVAPLGLSPLFVVMALGAVAVTGWRPLKEASPGLLAALFLLPAWCLLSSLWSIDPLNTAKLGLRMVMIQAAGLLLVSAASALDPRHRRLVGLALVAGVLLGSALAVPEFLMGAQVSKFINPDYPSNRSALMSRGIAVASVVVWGAVIAGYRRSMLLAAMAAATVASMVFVTDVLAAKVALLAGAVALAGGLVAPRLTTAMLRTAILVAVLLVPAALRLLPGPEETWAAAPWLPTSAHHRLTIWGFTADRAAERPILGWGGEAARTIPGGQERVLITSPKGQKLIEHLMPLHPHNAAMQVNMELGWIGSALYALMLLVLAGLPLRIQDRAGRAAALAAFSGALVVSMVSFGAWQSWWVSGLWLIAALYAGLAERPAD